MDSIGLVTSLRCDDLLLSIKENARFAPPSQRPEAFSLYLFSLHRDRILQAANAAGRKYPLLEGDGGLEHFAERIREHKSRQNLIDESGAMKVKTIPCVVCSS